MCNGMTQRSLAAIESLMPVMLVASGGHWLFNLTSRWELYSNMGRQGPETLGLGSLVL